MHPKNIFKLRPLALVLGSLLAVSGPCHLMNSWHQRTIDQRLVDDGVEVMAAVVELHSGQHTGARSAGSGDAHCRWQVAFEDMTCSEIFALPCPSQVTQTPMIFLPGDPSTCRVLSRAAVLAELEAPSTHGLGWLITVVGFGLVVGARRRRAERDPQVPLKESI